MRKAAILAVVVVIMFLFETALMAQTLGKVRGWVSIINIEAKSVTILPEG